MNPYQVNRASRRRVVVLFDPAEVDALDRIGVESGMTSRAETVRRLLRGAMNGKGPAGTAIPPSHDHSHPSLKDEGDDA